MRTGPILATGACAALVALAAATLAAEPHPMTAKGESLPYVHLYADANGVSHFRNERISLASAPAASADRQLVSFELSKAPGATLLALKLGAKEDWHRAPRRMWLIALTGMSEVTVGDGEVRRFGPGSLLLMDDTTGKGHITRAVGKVDHIALTIPAPAP
ncbi:MAG TPA: hypothetical protein VMU67_10285 [Steroidobacteraceae bacterium]|nr:hypothetical protein [Steroidobacteraceae bacterium]